MQLKRDTTVQVHAFMLLITSHSFVINVKHLIARTLYSLSEFLIMPSNFSGVHSNGQKNEGVNKGNLTVSWNTYCACAKTFFKTFHILVWKVLKKVLARSRSFLELKSKVLISRKFWQFFDSSGTRNEKSWSQTLISHLHHFGKSLTAVPMSRIAVF